MAFAETCPWKAGPYLANMMKKNDFLEWERVIAAHDREEIMGFCTLTAKDEIPDRYPYTPFIGFVYVDEQYRGNRISQRMIDGAAAYAQNLGYQTIYLMSGERGFYEKYGFEKVGDFPTVFGTVDQLFMKSIG